MSSMYQLPVYIPESTTVNPLDIVYALPNYHAHANSKTSNGSSNELVITDPVQMLEKKQLDLIEALNNLGGKLNQLLQKKGASAKSEKTSAPAPSVTKQAPAAESSDAAKDGGKKDKDAKKEARKAAKNDAKNKVASGSAPAPQQKAQKKVAAAGQQWTIKEEKKSTETGLSLTACMKPEYARFKKQAIGTMTMTVTGNDYLWVDALSSAANKMEVSFTGFSTNKVSKSQSVIDVTQGGKFFIKTASGQMITSRVTAWKLIGSAMGLFSYENTQAIQAAHQHQWLMLAERVMVGSQPVEEVVRAASQFLSRFDSLGSQFNVSIADMVMRAILPEGNLPNNVELWAGRIDSL